MKAEVLNEIKLINTTVMRLAISVLCAFFLFMAYFLKVNFFAQAIIFAFSIINMRGIIADGFEALCNVKPNANSLVSTGAFFTVLHGLIVLDAGENYFSLHALTLALFAVGEYINEKMFVRRLKTHTFTDRICATMLPLALVLFILTVILSLAFGEGLYETVRRAFSAVALFCPVSIGIIGPLVSFIYARISANNGVFINSADVIEKLGQVREIICDERGIITDEEYELYDIYAVNGDKAELLSSVAAIESNFENSFASATVNAAKKIRTKQYMAENCFEITGRGVGGTVNGDKYLIGNKKLLKDKKIVLPSVIANTNFFERTPLYVAKNSEFFGALLFYNRPKDGANQSLEKIRALGKRCILLAANEHTASKGIFDILLSEREKVLQEFKKSVKIKAMVISKKPIVNAEVVACIPPCDNADVVFSGMSGALFSLAIGKAAFGVMRRCVFVAVIIAMALAIAAASGFFVSSVLSAILTGASLVFAFSATCFKLPEITTSEEDDMFGKINYTMKIDGMNCAHCSARVKNALEEIKGVSAKISLEEKTARIKCSAKTTAEELANAVSGVGFTVVSTERV